mgnify:CR=1 FL=1
MQRIAGHRLDGVAEEGLVVLVDQVADARALLPRLMQLGGADPGLPQPPALAGAAVEIIVEG